MKFDKKTPFYVAIALAVSLAACSKKSPVSKPGASDDENKQEATAQASQGEKSPAEILIDLASAFGQQDAVRAEAGAEGWETKMSELEAQGVYNFHQDGGCKFLEPIRSLVLEELNASTKAQCEIVKLDRDVCESLVASGEDIISYRDQILSACDAEQEGKDEQEKKDNLHNKIINNMTELGDLLLSYKYFLSPVMTEADAVEPVEQEQETESPAVAEAQPQPGPSPEVVKTTTTTVDAETIAPVSTATVGVENKAPELKNLSDEQIQSIGLRGRGAPPSPIPGPEQLKKEEKTSEKSGLMKFMEPKNSLWFQQQLKKLFE
ncbi:MAG: hypothetical protein AB1540_10150 [Bdellovibrionota bacterium]